MRIHLLALWLVLSILVQGCALSTAKTLKQESITPIIDTQTPLVSPTVIPSTIIYPTATPSMAITNTSLPTPEPVQAIHPACFTMLPAIPITKTYPGKIIFLERGNYENIQDSHLLASIYNINVRQTLPMESEKVKNIEVSPDGMKYAIIDAIDKKVKFYSSNGQLLRSLPPGEYPYGLDHWLNNEQITINILQPWGENYTKYPIDQLIYNPFTSEQKKEISAQYPDIDQANSRMFWEGSSTTKYDPLLTRVVYPAGIKKDYLGRSGIGYVLWDMEKQVKLAEIVTGHFSATPKWVPDGSRFVINDSYGNGEFYVVTREGVVTQLSHLNSDPSAESAGRRYFSDIYSWSPNGRYLAFWLVSTLNSSFQGTLAILDSETGMVTDTCVSAGFLGLGTPGQLHMRPIWSPDGKSLVTVANRQEDGSYQSVLIDLEDEYAAVLAENKFPVGWLADVGD